MKGFTSLFCLFLILTSASASASSYKNSGESQYLYANSVGYDDNNSAIITAVEVNHRKNVASSSVDKPLIFEQFKMCVSVTVCIFDQGKCTELSSECEDLGGEASLKFYKSRVEFNSGTGVLVHYKRKSLNGYSWNTNGDRNPYGCRSFGGSLTVYHDGDALIQIDGYEYQGPAFFNNQLFEGHQFCRDGGKG